MTVGIRWQKLNGIPFCNSNIELIKRYKHIYSHHNKQIVKIDISKIKNKINK
jgi:hypothetical protein